MSRQEIDRFVEDLKSDERMRSAMRDEAAGVGSVVEFARARDYDITPDEVRAYLRTKNQRELSDEQLDAVAGGKGGSHHSHHSSHATGTYAAQTVAVATTEAVGVETTVNIAEEVEVATTGAVAAEAVAVVVVT